MSWTQAKLVCGSSLQPRLNITRLSISLMSATLQAPAVVMAKSVALGGCISYDIKS